MIHACSCVLLYQRIKCADTEREGEREREGESSIQVDFTITLRVPFSHAVLGSRSHLQNVRFTWWAVAAPVSLDTTEATFSLLQISNFRDLCQLAA